MSASTSLLELLISAALKTTLLLVLAAMLERTVLRRHASAAARHVLWALVLISALLVPALAWTLPSWSVDFPELPIAAALHPENPPAAPATANSGHAIAEEASTVVVAEGPPTAAPVLPAVPAPPSVEPGTPKPMDRSGATAAVPVRWTSLALAVYLLGALLLLARVAVEHAAVRRLSQGATEAGDRELSMLLRSLTATLGIRRPVTLLRSRAPTMPVTWGVTRPVVLVPSATDEWSTSRRRAVLLHELGHVARYDCLTQTLAAIACALYWPHPGVWWAAGRLRVESELACDDQALLRGVHPHDYAGHLLAIARGLTAPAAFRTAAVTMASPSRLEARIRAAIDYRRPRKAPGRRAIILGALLTTSLLLPIAAVRADAAGEAGTASVNRSAVPAGGFSAHAARSPEEPAGVVHSTRADPPSGARAEGSGAAAGEEETVSAGIPMDATARPPRGGEWRMRLAEPGEAGRAQGAGPIIHVALWAPGLNTFYVPLARLEGLTPVEIASPETQVRFRLGEDAGTFTFEGSFRNGRGMGDFEFAPDPSFADALASRGMQRPTPEQQFNLGRHDVDLVFLDELAAQGYARPSTEALVKVGMTGVDLLYLRDMDELGYRLGTLEALIGLYHAGVTPGYIRELAVLGYRGLSVDDLRRMRKDGVTAEPAGDITAEPAHDVTDERARDVTAERARDVNGDAGRQLSVEELTDLRNPVRSTDPPPESTPLEGRWVVHGAQGGNVDLELFWTDNTNWRRRIVSSELRGVSAGEMASQTSVPVSFRIEQDAGTFDFEGTFRAGRGTGEFRFRPDRRFTSTLRSLGVEGVGDVTDHQLKNFAYGGVGAAEIREFLGLGFSPLTFEDAIRLAIYRVTPEYARGMRSLGVSDAKTVRGLTDLRIFGVTLQYARDLAALGYDGLSGSQLIDLRRADVTPDFIRRVREAGYRNVSPDLLREMRRRGIDEIARREGLRHNS